MKSKFSKAIPEGKPGYFYFPENLQTVEPAEKYFCLTPPFPGSPS
jgi:hypothetical protein